MRADKVRYYLEKKANLSELTGANLSRLPFEDQMIISMIRDVIDNGNSTAFNALMDTAYGKQRPGDGAEFSQKEKTEQKVDWNLPELDKDE